MKILISLILLVLICTGAYVFVQHYRTNRALTDGSYTCVGCLPPDKAAAYDRYDHGGGPDPDFDRTRSDRDTAVDTAPQTYNSTPRPSAGDAQPADNSPFDRQSPQPKPSSDSGQYALTDRDSGPRRTPGTLPITATPPASDTAPANAQNGQRFSGSGTYQWYREGDLTWRLNTQTGTSCIVYATLEEWRKRVVLEHSCGAAL